MLKLRHEQTHREPFGQTLCSLELERRSLYRCCSFRAADQFGQRLTPWRLLDILVSFLDLLRVRHFELRCQISSVHNQGNSSSFGVSCCRPVRSPATPIPLSLFLGIWNPPPLDQSLRQLYRLEFSISNVGSQLWCADSGQLLWSQNRWLSLQKVASKRACPKPSEIYTWSSAIAIQRQPQKQMHNEGMILLFHFRVLASFVSVSCHQGAGSDASSSKADCYGSQVTGWWVL